MHLETPYHKEKEQRRQKEARKKKIDVLFCFVFSSFADVGVKVMTDNSES